MAQRKLRWIAGSSPAMTTERWICYGLAMTTVEDIEKAVAKLKPEQLAKFRNWFEEYQARLFDEQIERDAKTGKLDRLAEEALKAYREGRAREL
jgi:hypothetical protein